MYNGSVFLGSSYSYLVSDVLSTNQWYFVTSVYNGSTVKTFIGSSIVNTTNFSNFNLANYIHQIGANYLSSVWVFNGLIDDVRIYNRALSAAEIEAMYNSY